MPENLKVFVIVPVHNRVDHTLLLIDSLRKQTYQDFKLVLVDDGSKDGTEDKSRLVVPDLICLKGNGDLWWAGSLQKAYDWLRTTADYSADDQVLILNDDTVLPENFIKYGVEFIKSKNKTLLCAQGINLKTNLPQDTGGYHFDFSNLTFHETLNSNDINCLSTRGLILKVDDFLAIGGFYPSILPHYLSDLEYTYRAKKKGYRLETIPDFKIMINFETTGIKDIKDEKFFIMLKKMFSKKYTGNPIYWTVFILLCSPNSLVLKNIARVWREAYRLVFKSRLFPAVVRRFKNIGKFV